MGGHGRHRLKRASILQRGIYWGTRTTQATAAMIVACAALLGMAMFAGADQPTPTAAQPPLPAAVTAWKGSVATATFTTAPTSSGADSDRKPAKKKLDKG